MAPYLEPIFLNIQLFMVKSLFWEVHLIAALVEKLEFISQNVKFSILHVSLLE